MQVLRGHGIKVDDHWKGAVPEVDEWWTGDANSPVVLLRNYQEEVERNSIYNGKVLFGVSPFSLTTQRCFTVHLIHPHIRMLTLKCLVLGKLTGIEQPEKSSTLYLE